MIEIIMNTNKLVKLAIAVLMLFFIHTIYAQFAGNAYPNGIFVFCGKEIPKNFSYIIEKQISAGVWKPVAELKAPLSEAECRAAFMELPDVVASVSPYKPSEISFLWKRLQKANELDSLYAYGIDPRFQYVARTAWFDHGIKTPGNYQYRIKKLGKNRALSLLREVEINFPGRVVIPPVVPVRYRLNEKSISISYKILDKDQIKGIKLYRSNYLRNNFSEIPVEIIFTMQNNEMVAELTDFNVIKGLTYSYVAQAIDGLGNKAKNSDTLNIYFVAKPADLGLVTNLNVTPDPEKGGNLLKWDFKYSMNVQTIEVYRSESYNGKYQLLASLDPNQKEYFDSRNINPATTYFYYLAINNGYGSSLPSARVPAILEGRNPNLFPPQDVTITRKGKVVQLTFRRLGKDIRGYYIYRGDGYTAPLSQLQPMLLSTDSLLTYNDTLPNSIDTEVYSYAIASVNTSYNISPMSERVSISYSGGRLPVPEKVNVINNDKSLIVTWTDVAKLHSGVLGYRIFRETRYNDNIETPDKLIAVTDFMNNAFTDTLITPGRYYAYRIQCFGEDTLDTGSISQPTGFLYMGEPLLQPGNVTAIPSDKKIILKWTMPVSENLLSALIYRSVENGEPILLKETDIITETFEDTSAAAGTMYYYFIVLKYKNNLTSKPTDAVGAKWGI
jgi:hypothetical protein